MRAELLEAQEKHDREIRRLGRKALRERQTGEWLEELGVAEKLFDSLTADQLESIGKTYARRARKAQKTAEACFILARGKRREVTDEKN